MVKSKSIDCTICLFVIMVITGCNARPNQSKNDVDQAKTLKSQPVANVVSESVASATILPSQPADVYYPITPLQQEKDNDCWIASLTILKRWKNPNASIKDMVQFLGDPYAIYYQTNSGLPGKDLQAFYSKAGIIYDRPQNYTIDQWINILKTHGPAIVDVFSFIDPVRHIVWTHARVLVGIEKRQPIEETQFIFIDPAKGREESEDFRVFLQNYEAIPANQISKIQVAYLR